MCREEDQVYLFMFFFSLPFCCIGKEVKEEEEATTVAVATTTERHGNE